MHDQPCDLQHQIKYHSISYQTISPYIIGNHLLLSDMVGTTSNPLIKPVKARLNTDI